MQPESPKQSTVLKYGRVPKRGRWRTFIAIALAVPSGLWAGWWTDTEMAGWVAVVFFAVIGPLCLGLMALRYHAIISLLFCTGMSATLLRGGMQFYERIGDPYTTSQAVKGFLLGVVVTWVLSLFAVVPLMEARRRAA